MDPLSSRAPMRKAVFKSVIGGHETGRSIAEDTGFSITQVKSVLVQLKKHGFIQRDRRGAYEPNVPLLLLVLRDRVIQLEKRQRELNKETKEEELKWVKKMKATR